MAIAFVQGRAADAGAGSGSLAFSSAVTAGSLLLAATTTDTTATPAISDSHSQTWTWVDAKLNAAHSGIRLAYCMNAVAGATTISLSGSSAGYGLAIAEFSGAAISSALDGTLHGTLTPPNGTAAAPSGNAFTPSANDLAIGYYGDFGAPGTIIAAGSGWSTAGATSGASGYGASIIYRILTASISVTATWSGGGDTALTDEAVGWAAFLAAGSGSSDPYPAGYGSFPYELLTYPVYRM